MTVKMIEDMDITNDVSEVGYYSGIIVSAIRCAEGNMKRLVRDWF